MTSPHIVGANMCHGSCPALSTSRSRHGMSTVTLWPAGGFAAHLSTGPRTESLATKSPLPPSLLPCPGRALWCQRTHVPRLQKRWGDILGQYSPSSLKGAASLWPSCSLTHPASPRVFPTCLLLLLQASCLTLTGQIHFLRIRSHWDRARGKTHVHLGDSRTSCTQRTTLGSPRRHSLCRIPLLKNPFCKK